MHHGFVFLACVLALTGCAATKIDTQWGDPQFAGRSLQGKRVLVACDAGDAALRRACQEQLAAEVTALGASAVAGPEIAHPNPGRQAAAEHLLPAARSARAASGRLMWSAKASAPATRDAENQAVDLAKAVAKAAREAGLF